MSYSQDRVARELQIKQPSYARMESGRTRISADQLGMLAAFYQVPIHIFFIDTRSRPLFGRTEMSPFTEIESKGIYSDSWNVK